jgi:hypothetical protein
MLNVQNEPPLTAAGKDFENTSNVNPASFPEPRLQTNEVLDMDQLLESEHKILYADEPFVDQTGTVHLPINDAMKLIVERGLPVKPANTPTATAQKSAPVAKATAAPGVQQ